MRQLDVNSRGDCPNSDPNVIGLVFINWFQHYEILFVRFFLCSFYVNKR